MNDYNNFFECYLDSGKRDQKGRSIGYAVGFNDNGSDFRAWVQNSRKVHGEWIVFGATQRSKGFSSQKDATAWAYSTAHARIAGLK